MTIGLAVIEHRHQASTNLCRHPVPNGDEFAKLSSERRSRVAFNFDPAGEMVKLTVVHDDFEPGSTAATMVRKLAGPSSLKTLLETGEPLASTR